MARLVHPDQDILRLREEYARRADAAAQDDRYRADNPAYQWMISNRRQHLTALLDRCGIANLSQLRILEVGCGSGGIIREFISLGAEPSRLVGLDLLMDRLRAARGPLPCTPLLCGDGQSLPFESSSFDLVLQFTAFSSILSSAVKQHMASEIARVLKPSAALIWYDFWWNPLNRQTKGIPLKEVQRLFPGCSLRGEKITLAPPLARSLAPRHPALAAFLESLKVLNTHHLLILRKLP